MKTIGLIGGMSWESSIEYYRIINEKVREELGRLHSAKSVMVSVDFEELETLQSQGRWAEATEIMIQTALQVKLGGADFIVICSNTMHKMADAIQNSLDIPLLHIADATAEQIKRLNLHTIGLIGTRFTMEESFYRDRLEERYGLKVIIPEKDQRLQIHRVIYDELVIGVINPESKLRYLEIITGLVERGASGIILGCTEIGLLVRSEDCDVPIFDTTYIHATAAVKQALDP